MDEAQRLKMINRLLSLLMKKERADNQRLTLEEDEIFKHYTYYQIVKPLIENDFKTKKLKVSQLQTKYNLSQIQVDRIVKPVKTHNNLLSKPSKSV